MKTYIKVIFTASILLNVLFVGMIIGHVAKESKQHPWQTVRAELSPETQNIVARNFRNAARETQKSQRNINALKTRAKEIITAQNFDAAAFQTTMKEIHNAQSTMHTTRLEAMTKTLKNLSAAEREKIAPRLLRSLDRQKRQPRKRENSKM